MGLKVKGNQTLASLKRKLQEFPKTLAADVARRTAPPLTDLTQQAFTGQQTVYGDARPLGVDGQTLDLQRTGAVAEQLRFVSNGTIVRASLGPKYSRYLIGKYGILPNGPLPTSFRAAIDAQVKATPKP